MFLFTELSAYSGKVNVLQMLYHLFLVQGYQANILYRLSHYFYIHKLKIIGKIFARLNFFLTNADISCKAKIGKRLFLPHPTGIVIGEESIVGENCVLLHGVTLGSKNISLKNKVKRRHPIIGNDVFIGCNSSILGNCSISDGSVIKAHSIVLNSV